jgi:hypothetical protein
MLIDKLVDIKNAIINKTLQINSVDISNTNQIPVKKCSASASASITRPENATPYSANDVVSITGAGEVITFANVSGITGNKIKITRAWMRIDVNAVPSGMSGFFLHLFNALPTAIADNSAYNLPSADRAKYLGNIYIPTPDDLGDTLFSSIKNIESQYKLSGTALYGVLVTVGAFTPAGNSEVYNVGIEVEDV